VEGWEKFRQTVTAGIISFDFLALRKRKRRRSVIDIEEHIALAACESVAALIGDKCPSP
jgi:hypothetical protein